MKRFLPLYLMILPGLIYLIINNYLPMAGLALAFKKVNYSVGLFESPWCGFANFKYLVQHKRCIYLFQEHYPVQPGIYRSRQCSSAYLLPSAWTQSITNSFKRFSQVIILIPYLLSTVIISYVVYAFLSGNNGFMNMTILPMLGLDPVKLV